MFGLLVAWFSGYATAAPDAVDRAHDALSQKRPRAAVAVLEAAIGTAEGDRRYELLCLLGTAQLASGRPDAAAATLQRVPRDAPCGARAAFLLAEAHEKNGDLDAAITLLDEVGGPRLSTARDAASATAVVQVARTWLADRDRADQGARLFQEAVTGRFDIDDAMRIAWSRELADTPLPGTDQPSPMACEPMLTVAAETDDPADRVRAARVCSAQQARALLAPLPRSPELMRVLADRVDDASADLLLTDALALDDDDSADDGHATELARRRARAGRVDVVPTLIEEGTAESMTLALDTLSAAGRYRQARDLAAQLLVRFPDHEGFAEVLETLVAAALSDGRRALEEQRYRDARDAYDALVSTAPQHRWAAVAATEAGVAAYRAGEITDALQRWRRVTARWSGEAVARDALRYATMVGIVDEGEPTAALGALRNQAERNPDATRLAEALESTDVRIEGPSRTPRRPVVTVGARNLQTVDLKLHRIDVGAYLRSGGTLGDLRELDVAVVAPDRQWTVDVPDYAPYQDQRFELPVDVPGPGLYAITVASPTEEARALVLVSDLSVVARTVGPDLAVATFSDDGDPVGGVRIQVISPSTTLEGRTDGSGLWVDRSGTTSAGVVLAERDGSVAFVDVVARSGAASDALAVEALLERPVAVPGDRIGLQVRARQGTKPVSGAWSVWLEHRDTSLTRTTMTTDRRGLGAIDLAIPPTAREMTYTVMGLPPGAAEPTLLTRVRAVPVASPERSLDVRMEGDNAVIEVREPDGRPAQGVLVAWLDETAETDSAGQVTVGGPGAGIPWMLEATVPLTDLRAVAARPSVNLGALSLVSPQTRLYPSELPDVTLVGTGDTRVQLFRVVSTTEGTDAPVDPWSGAPLSTGPRGDRSWDVVRPGAPVAALELAASFEAVATEDGTTLPLEALPAGHWRIRATSRTADASPAELDVHVRAEGLRLNGASPAGLGQQLTLGVDGAPALVTAGHTDLAWAGVMRPGQQASLPVGAAWNTEAVLSAVAPTGDAHEVLVDIDPMLTVSLTETPGPDGTTEVVATVTDASGAPVAAQVALRAWDRRLGSAPSSASSRRPGGRWHTAVQVDFQDADPGSPISGALLAEARRVAEQRKAGRARRGELSGTDFARLSSEEIVTGQTFAGGLGAAGTGSGGGGFGRGAGLLGKRVAAVTLRGVRERVLWEVVETDDRGRARATLSGPPAGYRVHAVALTAEARGEGELEIDTRDRVWMVAHDPAPGFPGDQLAPRVTLVNGTDAPVEGSLLAGAEPVPVSLGAGEARTLVVGDPRGPRPEPVAVQFVEDDTPLATATWAFPLAAGPPVARGPIVTVRVGPNGSLPLAWLALPEDRTLGQEPWRYASRGRAALVAFASDPRDAVREEILFARDMLLLNRSRPTAIDAAQAVLFLAELRDSGLVEVPRAEIEAEAAQLQQSATVAAGVWAAFARARAGLPIDPDLLGFLSSAELSREHAGLLARTYASLGRDRDALDVLGQGLHADAARLDLGLPVDHGAWRTLAPPAPDDPTRADWLRVAAEPMRAATPQATVFVAGNPAQRLDLSRDAGVRFLAEGMVRVDAPGAMVFRSGRPVTPTAARPARAVRLTASPAGAPPPSRTPTEHIEEAGCNPCVIQVGDAIQLPPGVSLDPHHGATALVRATPDRFVAPTIGTVVLRGLANADGDALEPVHVRIIEPGAEGASPLPAEGQLALAALDVAADRPPTLPDPAAHPSLDGAITSMALAHALTSRDDDAIVEQFQRLVAVQPSTALPLTQVAEVARAMSRSGRRVEALRVWRAGLDAAFRGEAGRVGAMQPQLGTLRTTKLIYETGQRYPTSRSVGEALALLPSQLWSEVDGKPDEAEIAEGVSALDVRLTAAAWDRELLALQPEHPRAPSAGLRLARTLLTLGAPERAANRAAWVAEQFPDDPLSDSALYLEALARTEAGQSGAESLLRRLIDTPFPQPDGTPGASVHRGDAHLVMGRLLEAQGDYDKALESYRTVVDTHPDARRSVTALEARTIELPPLVTLDMGDEARIDALLQHVDTLSVRAYAVDLRTVFVRDGGLASVRDMAVAGVSPTWSGTRQVDVGPFPTERTLRLPLTGAGAWLVHIEHDGVRASTLVVRSALELHTSDDGGMRRVMVRRGGSPAAQIRGRVLDGSDARSITTDVRGVAEVTEGAPVLVFDGAHVAFTPLDTPQVRSSRQVAPAPGIPLNQLDDRLGLERKRDQEAYRKRFRSQANEAMSLDAL